MGPFTPVLLLLGATLQTDGADGWKWDSETPICRLTQRTPSGSIEVTRTPGNDETELRLFIQSLSRVPEGRFRDGSVRLDSSNEAVDVETYVDRAKQLQVYAVARDPTFMAKFSSASIIAISQSRIGSFQVPLPSPAAAVEALQGCEDKKMREWGVDPTAWRALRSRPAPLKPVRERFSRLDYPTVALMNRTEADAVTRLDVGPDGKVTRCQSVNAGLNRLFEEAACNVLKGARFRPAVDSAGNPVAAPVIFDVRFRVAR